MPWNPNIAAWADNTLSGITLRRPVGPQLPDLQPITQTVNNGLVGIKPTTISPGKRFMNLASSALGAASGLLGGPVGWAGLAISAIGDNIRAAKSQFDLNGFNDQLNDAQSDYLQAAGSANTTSDLVNLHTMKPDLGSYIDNQGYDWDGSILDGIGALIGNARTERDKAAARGMLADIEDRFSYGMQNALQRVNNNTYRFGMANFLNNAAIGGPLSTHGSDFSDDLIRIDAGGSHEQNPLGGVPAGIDPNGVPNLVEEGETIWDDYVFSKRLKVSKGLAKEFKLGGGKKGLSYSDAARRISEKSGATLRPNDPISKRTKDAMLGELEQEQEEKRMNIQRKQILSALQNMSPEEFQTMFTQQPASMDVGTMAPPQGVEEEPLMQEPMSGEPVEGSGVYEPIGAAGFALGGNIFDEGSRRQIGKTKVSGPWSNQWSRYSLPGVERYFNSLIEQYNKATTPEEKQAIRRQAINTVNNIQSGYRDSYNQFNANGVRYSDAVKAHQAAFDAVGGNYGFAGGNGVISVDDALSYPYRGHTGDNASGKFTPDGLFGWRTALRHFGANLPGSEEGVSFIGTLADKLDLDWNPTMEYGTDGYKLYTLSERQRPATSQIAAEVPASTPASPASPSTDVTQPQGPAVVSGPSEWQPEYLKTWMRYAPIIGSGISVLGNLFSNPDYSEYEGLVRNARRLGNPVAIPVETIGNRLRRNPVDERLAVNQANQNFLASIRGTQDISGGNRAYRQFANNLLAYNNQGALSDIATKAYLANRQDALQTADFNRGTDMYNANAINQRNLTQAQLNSNRQQAGFSALLNATQALDNARRYDDQFIDADLTGLFEGLGRLGKENATFNIIQDLARNGATNVVIGKDGRMTFVPSEGVAVAKCGGKIKTKKRRF